MPPSPGYVSMTASEPGRVHQMDERTCTTSAGSGHSIRLALSRRASSNVLGRTFTTDGARSDNSSASRRLHPQASNSTMRSHYDAKSSPLSISQQTSDSAVRDRALRRGQPSVLADYDVQGHSIRLSSAPTLHAGKKESRKSKPAKLDLSKLFPKPKVGPSQEYGAVLLSPTKMVNSPAAMSMVSDHFPRPMTREPTPQIGGQIKLKTTSQHQKPAMEPSRQPSSPIRKFKRDVYDNAKVHVRRPPKGIQHWFDALDEDSDESSEETEVPLHAPQAVRVNVNPPVSTTKVSLDHLPSTQRASGRRERQGDFNVLSASHESFAHEDIVDMGRLASMGDATVRTQNSLTSTKTKGSVLSKKNLQKSSVLSTSSSEDEYEGSTGKSRKFAVRKSLDLAADSDDVVIGQAQAFELRQHRRPSVGMMSMLTASTSAATIEVMYTPEPTYSPYHHPRKSDYSGHRSSTHARQPSVIPENDASRPRTAFMTAKDQDSRSVISARTSASEPASRAKGSRKMMAVTDEEEALLELMRKKRAAMAKTVARRSGSIGSVPETSGPLYRTSAFLSMEQSPVRLVNAKSKRQPAPLLLSPRGRASKAVHQSNTVMNQLRDSSASASEYSDQQSSPVSQTKTLPYLPSPAEFSPLLPFPPSSPTRTASAVSPTTTEHASPLPSPVTPGLRYGEHDISVKVASSDTSNEAEEIPAMNNEVVAAVSASTKSDSSFQNSSHHQRRRTASSGTDVSFPVPPTNTPRDLVPVIEASSRPPSLVEHPPPKLSKRSSKRVSGLALTVMTSNLPTTTKSVSSRSRTSSVHSNSSRTSSYSQSSSVYSSMEKRSRKSVHRGVTSHPRDDRNSVSEDVLAAWNNLGGTY